MCFIVLLVNIVILIEQIDQENPNLSLLKEANGFYMGLFSNLHNTLNISRW